MANEAWMQEIRASRANTRTTDAQFSSDFRFGCGTFAHSISRQALIFASFSRETRPRRVTPSG